MASAGESTGNASTVEWRVLDDARHVARAVTRAGFVVDTADVEAFQRDGVAMFPGAFTEWVDALRCGLERNLNDPGRFAFPCESTTSREAGRFFDSYCNWQLIPEYFAYVMTSAAASLAASVMQSETAQLFHEHAFAKEAGTSKATPWHQDLPYYCVDGRQTASVYVALDEIPAEIAVKFVRGSHRGDVLYYPRTFADGSSFRSEDSDMWEMPDIDATVDPADIVVHGLAPGDTYVFDFRTVHGSGAATVAARRRAFSTRWLGDDAVYCPRRGETSPPLSGLDTVSGARMREDWFPVLWPN